MDVLFRLRGVHSPSLRLHRRDRGHLRRKSEDRQSVREMLSADGGLKKPHDHALYDVKMRLVPLHVYRHRHE